MGVFTLSPTIPDRKVTSEDPLQMAPPLEIRGSLSPYAGVWNASTARHLLSRASFGPTAGQIAQAMAEGMEATIDQLFAPDPEPPLPINYDNMNDPNVPVGTPWVYAAITPDLQYAQRSMRAWQMGQFLGEGPRIRQKMVLFWHNHFVTSDAPHGKFVYQYAQLLRQHALGNFRELTRDMTINSLMLLYLNGNENNKNAPNENYARELLELFTIGKGPQAGPGDYTFYTEEDIKEIARALTGWVIDITGFLSAGAHPPAIFRPNRHDTGIKTLSHRFQHAVISNQGADEYKTVVDILFQQEEVSRFLARKLYRWFVYYHIDDVIEADVIEPLAAIIRASDYEIQPALTALLSSAHFYHENAIGCMIKSPLDFTASIVKTFEVDIPFNERQTYTLWFALHVISATLQQDMFAPPDVAGWKSYYQEPVFYRTWINSVTLPIRRALTDGLASGQIPVFDRPWGVDVLKMASRIPLATDPNSLIRGLVELSLPWPLPTEQMDYLKEVLIPGLPDFEWTVEYGAYLNDPLDDAKKMAVENRLRALFVALMSLPEFQLH